MTQVLTQVGIVNDLRMAAEALRRIVADTPGFGVAWVAHDGESALRHHREHPAEIVLMDLIMPGMDGVQTTEAMMRIRACAILVVTATVTGNRTLVFAAMGKGALDAVNTPEANSLEGAEELRRKLITVKRLVRSAATSSDATAMQTAIVTSEIRHTPANPHARTPAVIGIGASTGGPQAIATILHAIPPEINAAFVIVQHLDKQFVPGLQRWIQQETPLTIHLATNGEALRRGAVWLSCSDEHLVVRNTTAGGARLQYTSEPADVPHSPSVSVFFESLAHLRSIPRCGILLTGMGGDGAAGLLAMRTAGALTMAQDAASCVVYGMPGIALKVGAVSQPTPLREIAAKLVEFAGLTSRRPIDVNT